MQLAMVCIIIAKRWANEAEDKELARRIHDNRRRKTVHFERGHAAASPKSKQIVSRRADRLSAFRDSRHALAVMSNLKSGPMALSNYFDGNFRKLPDLRDDGRSDPRLHCQRDDSNRERALRSHQRNKRRETLLLRLRDDIR